MTASLSESQTSSPPRRIGTSRLPPDDAIRGLERAAERLASASARAPRACETPGDPLGGGVPEHDLALAIDGDDPVGDVREDRLAALLLVADALVELGVHARAGCVAASASSASTSSSRHSRGRVE